MNTQEKLKALREHMKNKGADILLITSDDYHQSEYVGDYFKSRAYISGFTGSAGTLVITADDARLFTDGRYYIQAEKQLEGSTITLMRSGSEGVPTPTEFIASLFEDTPKKYKTLAFDGKCVSAQIADTIRKKLPDGTKLFTDIDFPALIWENRPKIPSSEIWQLDISYAGKSHTDKLQEVREVLKKTKSDALVLSGLCDIAWLYNLRGNDVKNTPVFLSFSIITEKEDMLFADEAGISGIRDKLQIDNVKVMPYDDFYTELKKLSGLCVTLDKAATSEAVVCALSDCKIINEPTHKIIFKAKKNEIEIENLRRCHIADGLALTKMMLELKFGDKQFDELSLEKYLLNLRKEAADKVGVHFVGESFDAICAFGANAAMMHYSATEDSFAKIDKNAEVPMLLVDSGGQYLEGTTDITRTFILGKISDEIKEHYTRTAIGMLRLANLTFLEGATGSALDIICREPLWEIGIDYRCGTGHGVGYLLSVHEGPNRFHWLRGDAVIEEGMITTDEPGVYVEGSHGIRIENELISKKALHNEYGQFMNFENLTFCPIDLEGIIPDIMDRSDVKKLNDYHKSVYYALSPYLCESDKNKLMQLTREIG